MSSTWIRIRRSCSIRTSSKRSRRIRRSIRRTNKGNNNDRDKINNRDRNTNKMRMTKRTKDIKMKRERGKTQNQKGRPKLIIERVERTQFNSKKNNKNNKVIFDSRLKIGKNKLKNYQLKRKYLKINQSAQC